jgi:hypothetical protein
MSALECRTLTTERMTLGIMYIMAVTIIYTQSHCACLFKWLVSGVDWIASGVWNYNVPMKCTNPATGFWMIMILVCFFSNDNQLKEQKD